MPKTTCHFAVVSKITLEHEKGAASSVLTSADFRLEVSGNIDKSVYLDGRGLPRKEALKPITNTLVAGLTANIQLAHEKGWMPDYEHLKYVIDLLQRQFVFANKTLGESTMEY